MKKYLLIILILFYPFSANGEEKLAGTWEGYFVSPDGSGYLRITLSDSQCFVVISGQSMWSNIKPEKMDFECESLIQNNVEYEFTIVNSFPDKSGEIQRKFILAISHAPKEQYLSRTIEGVWITKLVGKNTGVKLVETVSFSLTEMKDKSILEYLNEILR